MTKSCCLLHHDHTGCNVIQLFWKIKFLFIHEKLLFVARGLNSIYIDLFMKINQISMNFNRVLNEKKMNFNQFPYSTAQFLMSHNKAIKN